ncbi:MAG TPA: aminotransferase class I/II-fold pyridoxal phosphate-dependent enzyme [Firmicutes bacterium]|nr:aminotransferase class I/II-fold pyridoxal phosphate-dependent enzyme [Bacillota bacterium]
MIKPDQNRTPLFDAVKRYMESNVIPFHVPGHKHGQGIPEFREFLGETAFKMDLNGMEDLDFATNPTGAILEAEKLFAQAFGAEAAFFLVNGASSGVLNMILSACDPGDQIIIPRNAHKSTIGAIILSGAMPVYVQPEINEELGIATGVTVNRIKQAIKDYPHAKAVFVINPSYYGIAPDLKSIVRVAHYAQMAVLVDEAHGAHMSFHDDFPLTAMEVGADMSAISMHKTGGSLTQSAALLIRGGMIQPEAVKHVLNLTFTTSASYLLMTSLDVARKQLAVKGNKLLERTLSLVRWAREEINQIDGLYAFGRELVGAPGFYDFDETKLTVSVAQLGLTGYETESILRKEYNIQIELADLYNVLPYISIGDTEESVRLLIDAFKDLASKHAKTSRRRRIIIPKNPQIIVSPRDAFYSSKKVVPLEQAKGEIAGEMIMAYPPGIPVICMGERIDQDIIDYIKLLKSEKCELQGTVDPYVEYVRVLGVE